MTRSVLLDRRSNELTGQGDRSFVVVIVIARVVTTVTLASFEKSFVTSSLLFISY